jgi:hypothetical protein
MRLLHLTMILALALELVPLWGQALGMLLDEEY